jgi:hypothetical protein
MNHISQRLMSFYKEHIHKFPGLSSLETINVTGCDVPMPYIIGCNNLIVPDVINEPNMEVRTRLIQLYGDLDTGWGVTAFLRDGGGRLIKEPKKGDYQDAAIYELDIEGIKSYWLKLINKTPVFGYEKMTEEQRIKNGLSKDGCKIYISQIPHGDFETLYDAVGFTFGKGPGEYKPTVES